MSLALDTGVPAAPIGWYPDPAGSPKLRFWNGTSWTTQLESAGALTQPCYNYDTTGAVVRHYDY